ncbi:universal stress protein [Flaviaesturariibacter amylovorans]|uniref:Universal stress protein n=1 Tax=Flaviaesturariibacter amylovorans TaxID=1084520 RepID=A0ABP8H5Q0_9BACT
MKKILVPTDFSPNADKAFEYALQIARKVAGEILLLHVCTLPLPEYAEQPEGMKDYNRQRVSELSARLNGYKDLVDGREWVSIRTMLVDGDTVDVIVEKAIQHDADMIVMGTRGAGFLKGILFGTNTAAVMAASKVPVMVVPDAYEGAVPSRMLLAVDRDESTVLLNPLFRLRELFGAELKTLVFSETGEPADELMEHAMTINRVTEHWSRTFGIAGLRSEHLLGDDFCDTVNAHLEANDVNMLAMVTHRNRGLQSAFGRSLTQKMSFYTKVPLLSLHA